METDPLGRQTSYGYSPRGQRVSTTLPDPDGNGPLSAPQITRSYNARGDLVSQTDAMGNTTAWTYNARQQVLTQTDADPDGVGPMSSPVTSFTYDLAGQRTSVTDPVGNITSYWYDHAGRLVEEIDPRGRSTFYHYNPAGEVTRVVDRNSRKRDFTYNDLGLVTQEAWVDGFGNTVKTITRVYDDAGREVDVTDEVTSYQYQYDLADRVIQVDNAGSVVPEVQLDFQYDFEGNRTWMGDSLGGNIGYTWGEQRLQSMRMTTQNKSAQVDFGHDSMGRLSSISRLTNDNPATTIDTAYNLDLLDRVTSITHQKVGVSTNTLSQFSYSYDANGRAVSSAGPEGTLSFALDANGQLLSVNGSRTESYGFDANGNRSSSATGAGNLLLNDSQYSFTYDFEGNRKTRTRLSDGQITEYYWDHRNQLTLALVKDANGVTLKELRFTYDVEGRRVGVWTDGAGPTNPDQVWTVFDGVNPYMDLNTEGQLKTRYLHGPGIDELFARIGTGGDPEWYLSDRLGSVRQIVDGAGAVLDEITYDSYGNILTETNPNQGDRFKFTGREFSAELGIYYYRARWYDPAIGQFISQDPIGFRAGDPNLYRYVGNGPGDATDPWGLTKGGKKNIKPSELTGKESKIEVKKLIEELRADKLVNPARIRKLESWLKVLKRNSKFCLGFSALLAIPDIVEGAEKGGWEGGKLATENMFFEIAIGTGVSFGVGSILSYGAGLAGTTITIGNSVAVGAVASTGVGGVTILTFAGGYLIGEQIGSLEIGDKSIQDRIANGIILGLDFIGLW